jgi:hypothetical protein
MMGKMVADVRWDDWLTDSQADVADGMGGDDDVV